MTYAARGRRCSSAGNSTAGEVEYERLPPLVQRKTVLDGDTLTVGLTRRQAAARRSGARWQGIHAG